MTSESRKYFCYNTAAKSKVEKTVLQSPSCNLVRKNYRERWNTEQGVLDATNILNCVTRNSPLKKKNNFTLKMLVLWILWGFIILGSQIF